MKNKRSAQKTIKNPIVTRPNWLLVMRSFLWQHWFAIVIVILGTWVRVHDLPNRAILFPDAGRDLLVAAQAVKDNTLPLLGIPSSVPRFKQGPLTIWLQMGIFQIVGYDLTLYSLVFAFIGILAMVLIYETGIVFFNRRVGQLALILLAFSPMAIAHSRMPYHTNPIPLFTIGYWWGLQAYLNDKKGGLFWAALSGALLFQFELSMFPVLAAIFILMFLKKHSLLCSWKQLAAGFGIGLLPQILFDLQNKFAQLGGFAIWIGYRVASFFIPSQHSFGSNKITQFFDSLATYLPRLWAIDIDWSNWFMFCILLATIGLVYWQWKQKRSKSEGLLLLLFALISVGYFVHGSPSEAYYPIYFVLLPLLIAAGLPLSNTKNYVACTIVFSLLGMLNLQSVLRHNFFVSTSEPYNYGPSYQEQQLIARATKALLPQTEIKIGLANTQTLFPSSFDNIQWAMNDHFDGQATPVLLASPTAESQIVVTSNTDTNSFTYFHEQGYRQLQIDSHSLWVKDNSP